MQGETVGAQGYANAAVAQSEYNLSEQALGGFANLATVTAVDRGLVAQLTVGKKIGRQCNSTK
jgi:hypothetical protein